MNDIEISALNSRLDQLVARHIKYKSALGKRNVSRAWTVWELLGAMLALSYRATGNVQKGDDTGNVLLLRLVSEYTQQVQFFSDPQTRMAALKDYNKSYHPFMYTTDHTQIKYTVFNKKLSKQQEVNYRHQTVRRNPSGLDYTISDSMKDITNLISMYSHPSKNLTKLLFQTDRNDGSYQLYDYKSGDASHTLSKDYAKIILDMNEKAMQYAEYLYTKHA